MDNDSRILATIEAVAGKQIPVGREDSLFESRLLDSFVLVDLVAALEQEFSLTIPDADLIPQRFDSILKIEQYVAARLKE